MSVSSRRQKRWAIVESKQVRAAHISSALGNKAQTQHYVLKHSSEVGSLLAEVHGIGSLKASLQGPKHLDTIFPEVEKLEQLLIEHAGSNYEQQNSRQLMIQLSPRTRKISEA